MKPTIHGPATRLSLALGLVAGTWLIPLAAAPDVDPPSPADAAIATAEPDRIYLAQAEAVPVERPVFYSTEQADRGEEEFESECEECHGDNLRGGLNGGPPLRGLAFQEKFGNGLPASLLFSFMSGTMPPQAPGRFSPSTYADLMAHILKGNGFQAGAPLPSDIDALEYLIMEK